MGSADHDLLLKNILSSTVFLLLYTSVIAQDGPSFGPNPQEKDALYALKASFRDPVLDANWTGPHCDVNQPWHGIQCLNGSVTEIVLEDMGLSGEVNPNLFISFPELSVLSFKNNSLFGIVMNFSSNLKMNVIDLSFNTLIGPISDSLLSLNFLVSLQLQDNILGGPIPRFNQSTLKVFNVSANHLSGRIPRTQILQSFDYASYSGNAGLCGPPSPTACNDSSPPPAGSSHNDSSSPPLEGAHNDSSPLLEGAHKDSSTPPFNAMSFIFNVVLLVALVLLFILYYTKVNKLKTMLKERGGGTEETEDQNIMVAAAPAGEGRAGGEERGNLIFMQDEARFEFSDLLRASAEGLGKGIFGNSYMAKLNGGPSIVVKRLRDLKPFTSEEFTMQLRVIADLKHPNLLPLLACYHCNDEKLLLYKYAQNGNLFNRIHGERRTPFKWSARLSVAQGVARALEFLHLNTKSQTIVPHGNLKSSNVLLDENDMVLVSDYGLASLVALPIATQRMVSYKSPEYQTAKRVSKQSDVWSYGCLLLELLTAKIPAMAAPPGINGVHLSSWIHRALREEWTAEVFDPEISMKRSASPGMVRLLQIAMRCCDNVPEERPEMTEVVREVEHIKAPPDQSEDEDDLSLDRSINDDSITTTAAGIVGDDER